MRRRVRLGTTLAIVGACLAVLAVLAGCGDDEVKSNNAYVAATDKVVQSFETAFQGLQAEFTPVSTPAQDVTTLNRLRTTVAQAVADLGAVKPPDAIKPLHARLVGQVREYETAITAAEQGFAADDPEKVNDARDAFSATLQRVAAKVTATINTINQKLR